jgi:formylglycine-generating enzyme required for sulfatase activity
MTKGDRFSAGAKWGSDRVSRALIAMALPVVLASSACNGKTPPAGLEVIITTSGLQAGTDFDAIEGVVSQQTGPSSWNKLFDVKQSVPVPLSLPTNIAVDPGKSPDQEALIEITALKNGAPVVRAVAQLQVPTDRVAQILMVLAQDCEAQVTSCPSGESCQPATGTCGSNMVNSATLPTYPSPWDAGPFAEEEAGVDATTAVPDGAAPGPHCAPGGPGLSNCGVSQDESCCTSLEVPGGVYYRTYDLDPLGGGNDWAAPEGGVATGLADPATVSTFRLDKYDVTVGRFRQFIDAWNGGAGWTPDGGSGKHTHLNGGQGLVDIGASPKAGMVYETGWVATDDSSIAPTSANLACDPPGATLRYATWTAEAGSNESRPINCVSWAEAYAFCIWDGGFLPSEAEWEYAAAGGNQQRTYPWGATDPGTTSQYAIYGCYYPSGPPGFKCSGVSNIAPVGTVTAGAGLFGHLDLAGEMYQWNLDWYDTYGSGDTDGGLAPCTDCANLTATFGRVVRGGDFLEGDSTLLTPFRNFLFKEAPFDGQRDFGLTARCARSP